jgi:glycosyltransferase involved in cell wall biosynthesis
VETRDLVSIVVPSHNRRAVVSRLLTALADQDHRLDRLEVIVVADGCTDDTYEVLSRYRAPFSFRLIEQPASGPASARNTGAEAAKGEWLLFLDDDVVPSPELVTAHLRAHHRAPGGVVVGPYPPAHVGVGLLDLVVQSWWLKTFEEVRGVGRRHCFTSVLTGNLSLRADLFRQLGGFDTRFRAHEDYEFGLRLIQSGIPIVCAADALALHHYHNKISGYIKRKADEGRADVMLIERYPHLATGLPVYRLVLSRAWRDLAIRALGLGRVPVGFLTTMLEGCLNVLERAGLRKAWHGLKRLLENYVYLRAVADQLGDSQSVLNFCRSLGSHRSLGGVRLELDLSTGLADAERKLDLVQPAGARVRYQSRLIGVIHCQPGAEPLRGLHLRAALTRDMAAPLLEALALAGGIVDGTPEQRRALFDAIQRQRYWFGPVRPGEMWFEQYGQWRRFERPELAHDRSELQFWEAFTTLAREVAWLGDEYCEVELEKRKQETAR